jgi:phosphate transport system substrate-binding protein
MNRLLISAAITALVAFAAEAQARDQIRVVGSSTVFPFTTAVAEQFGVKSGLKTPVVESTGTGGGMKLFCGGVGEGHPDFTNASRRMKKSEFDACAAAGVTEITEIPIGFDGIAVANSKAGPDLDITLPQLWLALAKEVPVDGKLAANPYKNWSEIDASLPNEKIEVLGPPPTSGTRDSFVELALAVGCADFPEVKAIEDEKARAGVCHTIREDGVFVEAGENDNLIVQKLKDNPVALGVFGFSFLDQNSDSLKGAKLGGVPATYETILDGSYPISRSMFVYAKNAHAGVIPGMREFIAEYVSEAAMGEDGYLADKGLVVLPEEELVEVRSQVTQLTPLSM